MSIFRTVRAWVDNDVLRRCVGAEFEDNDPDLGKPYHALYGLLLQKGLDVGVVRTNGQWALEGNWVNICRSRRLLEHYLMCLENNQAAMPELLDVCSTEVQTDSNDTESSSLGSVDGTKPERETKKSQTEMVDCSLFTQALNVNVDEADETVQFLTDDGVSIGFLKFEKVFPKRPKKKKKGKKAAAAAAANHTAATSTEAPEEINESTEEVAPTLPDFSVPALTDMPVETGSDSVSVACSESGSMMESGDTVAEVAASYAAQSMGLVKHLEEMNCIASIIPKPNTPKKNYKKREKGLPKARVQPSRKKEPAKPPKPPKKKKKAAPAKLTVVLSSTGRPKRIPKRAQDPFHKYQCQMCCFAAPLKRLLQDHMKHRHTTRFKKCPVCPKKYTTDRDLQFHMQCHDELYHCERCGKRYKFLSSLQYHERCHEDGYIKSPIPCNLCEKTFSTHNAVKLHIDTVHLNKKDFLCNYCGKAFAQKRGLMEHENVHLGRKPYECKTCGVAFHFSSSLKDHENTHDLSLTYTCQICQKTFSSRGSLKTHMAIHTSQDKFKCDHCKKSFYQKAARDRHMRTHTGEKPYPCKLCNQKFSDNGILRRHMIGLHKQVYVRGKRGRKTNDEGLNLTELTPVEGSSQSAPTEMVPVAPTYSGMGNGAGNDIAPATFPNLSNHINPHLGTHAPSSVQNNHHLMQQHHSGHISGIGHANNPSSAYSIAHTAAHQHPPVHRGVHPNNEDEQDSNRSDMMGHTLDLSDHHGSVDMRTSVDPRSHSETSASNSQALYAHHLNLAAMQPGIDGNTLYRFPTSLPYMMATPTTSVSSVNNYPSHTVTIPTDSNGRPLVFPPFNIPN